MESTDASNKTKEQEQTKLINSNNMLRNLKSKFILKKLFDFLHKRKPLEIIRYNKNIQKKMKININHYKEYSEKYSSIEIAIKPIENRYGKFIDIDENEEEYYHIYYNDNKKEEIKSTYINEDDKVSKINIIINYQVTSFKSLFYKCECIKSINFKKFNRNNITDMKCMFYGCSELKELNLNNFNTNNVTDMNYMFYGCSSLKELNLNNFNTNNVTNMSGMFRGCSSLNELNLNNFNTNNVIYMDNMFSKCSDELKLKIKRKFKIFKEEAFEDDGDYEN